MTDIDKNWIAPEQIEDHPEMQDASSYIRNFFAVTWQEERFDYLRDTWDKDLQDKEPSARVMARTAAWAVVRLQFPDIEQEFKERMNSRKNHE